MLRDRLDTAPDKTWNETIENEPDRGADDAALANRRASSRRSTDDAIIRSTDGVLDSLCMADRHACHD